MQYRCTKRPDPQHFLWALMLLKRYDTWEILASAVRAHEQTVKKWSEIYLEAIARLDKDVVSAFTMAASQSNSLLC